MKVKFNDLARMYNSKALAYDDVILKTVRSGWWLNGIQNEKFCNLFAEYLDVKYVIGCANGTDALALSFKALMEQDDKGRHHVITAANAGGYAVTSLYACGGIPVYADVDPKSAIINFDSVLSAVNADTLAVVITHLYGGLADVPTLRTMLDDAGYDNVAIVEDCAQAHGLSGSNGKAGSLGTISAFSFYPTKNLGAFGDGGCVSTNNIHLSNIVRQLQKYGWEKKYHIEMKQGQNSRLDEIQAAILSVQLPTLDDMNGKRRKILHAYKESLPSNITLIESQLGTVGHLAVLRTSNREALIDHLNKDGVMTDIHFPILDCDQLGLQSLPRKIAPGGLPVSEQLSKEILSIPCYPFMTAEEIDHVCSSLSQYV